MFHRRVIKVKVGQTKDTLHDLHLNMPPRVVSMPGLHETATRSIVNHAQFFSPGGRGLGEGLAHTCFQLADELCGSLRFVHRLIDDLY